MTDDQKRRKLEANRAYRERQRLKKSQEQPSFESTPNPDQEEAWKRVETDGKPISAEDIVHYVDSKEKAEAVQAEAVARKEYVNHLFSKYEKNTNIPQLLQGIIREQIETRVVLIDLHAEILNEVRK